MQYFLQNEGLSIRYMTEQDFPLMAKWLSDKRVLTYYGDPNQPFDLEKISKKYLPRVNGEIPIVPCIIEYNDMEIGFIQYYKITEQQLIDYGYNDHPLTLGIDQFIGEINFWNKGIGTVLVQSILQYLFKVKNAKRVILDPDISNRRAIRCYEKCGFKRVKELPNQSLLMECVEVRKAEAPCSSAY